MDEAVKLIVEADAYAGGGPLARAGVRRRMSAIAVYCASITRIDPAYLELAAAVGAAIGGRGHTLVTGGGSVSMMGAVGARGQGRPAATRSG